MKKVFLVLAIIFAFAIAQAGTIKKIQTYTEKQNLDVLLLSKKKFSSNPKILTIQNEKIIIIQNASIDKKWQKKFSSIVLASIEIFSRNNNLYIAPKATQAFDFQAAKSKDGYTLRLRFIPKESINPIKALMNNTPQIKSKSIAPPQKNPSLTQDYQYWVVLGIMAFLILVLLFVRKKFNSTISWKKNKPDPELSLQILSSKNIDQNNKVVLLQNQNYGYILLLSNKQNLLIDKINLSTQENKRKIIDDDFWASLKQNSTNNRNAR